MGENNTRNKIIQFISENFVIANSDNLDDTASFMENGVIDSTGILELIGFIEDEFNIEVDDDDMVPENLDSIENVVGYIQKKLC